MKVGKYFVKGEFCVIKNDADSIVGDHVRISDFCRISSNIRLGDHIEIAPYCSIAGGDGKYTFEMKGYSSLAAGVKVWLSSNDYRNGLVTHSVPNVEEIQGNVTMDLYTGVGTNSVIMPNNHLPEGVRIGAMSFVPSNYPFEPWTLYAGCPIKKIAKLDKEEILKVLK